MEGWGSWEGRDPLDHSLQAGELTAGAPERGGLASPSLQEEGN